MQPLMGSGANAFGGYSPSHRGILHSVSEATQCPDRRQRVGGIFRTVDRAPRATNIKPGHTHPQTPRVLGEHRAESE